MSAADSPCIRCGDCLPVCPAGLSPLRLFALWGDSEIAWMAEEESLDDCLLCRRCDNVCPSSLPLADSFAAARKRADDMRRRADDAARLRLRHEAHLRRFSAPRRAKLNPAELAARARVRAAESVSRR